MDPNSNPTPNPNPAPDATPAGAQPAEPAPTTEPTVPATPIAPTTGTGTDATPTGTEAVQATAAGGITEPPVNPIINPVGNPTAPGAIPDANSTDAMGNNDGGTINPSTPPTSNGAPEAMESLSTIPSSQNAESASGPATLQDADTPMKAAEPAPGSIGSAVSGPAASPSPDAMGAAPADNPFINNGTKAATNVAFNDPAMQPDPAMGGTGATNIVAKKKKNDKIITISLIAVTSIIVIVLIIILVLQLTSGGGNKSSSGSQVSNSTPASPTVIDDNTDSEEQPAAASGTLSCTRNMTAAEIARYNDAASGNINISAEFDSSSNLLNVALVESVVYNDEDSTNNEPVEETVHEALAEDIDASSAPVYFLPVDDQGVVDLSESAIRANYEALDYTCEVL